MKLYDKIKPHRPCYCLDVFPILYKLTLRYTMLFTVLSGSCFLPELEVQTRSPESYRQKTGAAESGA